MESTCRRQNNCDVKIEFVFGTVENIMEKGENAGYKHFLLLSQCFQKFFFFIKLVKS